MNQKNTSRTFFSTVGISLWLMSFIFMNIDHWGVAVLAVVGWAIFFGSELLLSDGKIEI